MTVVGSHRRAVVLAAWALLLAAGACRREASRPQPLTAGLLNLAAEQGETPPRLAATLREIDAIAAQVTAAQSTGLDPAAALRKVVFGDLGFSREVDSPDLRYVLLPPVTAARKGGCVGLGTLYLVLAERLGLPLQGVLVPGHFFVRARDRAGQVHNVELLHQGEETPDEFYRQRYPTSDPAPAAYLRGLDVSEVLAVVLFNIGNQRRLQGRLDDAEDLYRRASQAFPSFAEAHASLGLTLHLEGHLLQAQRAYAAARRAQSDLPGLDRNLAALAAELGRGGAAAPGPDAGGKGQKRTR